MAKKISEFETKSILSKDAYIPLIDYEDKSWENYKIKVVDYFYNKSEINDKITNLNNKIIVLENNLPIFKDSIDNIIKGLEINLNEEINKKQNKNVGAENKVIVSDNDGAISASDILTTELNCLKGIKDNIQTQIDNNNLILEEVNSSKKGYVNYLSREYLIGNEVSPAQGSQTLIAPYDCLISVNIGCEKTSESIRFTVGYVYIDDVFVGYVSSHVTGDSRFMMHSGSSLFLPVKKGQKIFIDISNNAYIQLAAFKWN